MQKWSPEPFEVEDPAAGTTATLEPDFESLPTPEPRDDRARLFRSESGFADTRSLMASLTSEERAQVYELVELDLEAEYKRREAELSETYAAQLAADRAESAARVDRWTAALEEAIADQLREAAVACARLAVEIAGKIVRGTVAVDPAVVARAIETTLFKVPASGPLTIRTNPADARWLEGQPRLRESLHIGRIVGDRRLEAGGCVIECDGRAWDASLARQLDTLGELVAEMIATGADRPEPGPRPVAAPPAPDGPAGCPVRPDSGEDGDEPCVE